YIFALIVGFVWVFLRRIPIRFISWLITWIMEFIRSTPPLVQLFFLCYGLPVLPGVGVSLSAFTCAVIGLGLDRKSTRLNSSHVSISYAVFCLKKKKSIINNYC